jgi:hypothetical protein
LKIQYLEICFFSDLNTANELVYKKCGWDLTNLQKNTESTEYGACSFILNLKIVQFRKSKITPTKIGQFVAIWKRNLSGITEPFDISDNLDFMIISSSNGDNFGQFIFPKSVLAANGIITVKTKNGERGMRVYPPWDKPTNKQAITTQRWQIKYFISIQNHNTIDIDFIKKLFSEKY